MEKSHLAKPTLPGFYLPRRGRRPHSPQKVLADKINSIKQKSLKQIGEIFNGYFPAHLLKQDVSGPMSRKRFFTKENTFWAFFGQVLDADGGCKEVVRKLQSYASVNSLQIPSSSSASYCTARKKLSENMLFDIFTHTTTWAEQESTDIVLNHRRIIVVDGTGVSMPDTVENQQCWPQPAMQKLGCGFPVARICACFSLNSGALLSYEIGNKKNHELPLLRKQWSTFKNGDIFLADKGFYSYYDLTKFLNKGVDSIVAVARRKPATKSNCIKELGPDDLLIAWSRPTFNKNLSYSKETWQALPQKIFLRQIRIRVDQPGFRSKEIYIVTTLLDSEVYSKDELAAAYLKRWEVELFFRDIKTTMGFDILRCRTPEMVRKEVLMHFIAYNCLRRMMHESASKQNSELREISFKGTLQAVRNWEPRLTSKNLTNKERFRIIKDLMTAVVSNRISIRPGRSEPRCKKRRPKPFQLMTKPRAIMREIPHRSKYVAKKGLN
ncbi:IS4 family transposase [Desulfosediminicola ganghwensis]|uniref:IS4 family transposase n=1 Tax=Desulfosediminicola ganghwensis TaxID=2569540 RepID=UPI0010ABA38A|nr:IS4 family transposase [Desulfosediminicola ganghwensis]